MRKKVKVHILPTGDITGIVLHSTGLDKIVHTKESELNAVLNIGGTSQHLYLTSDEKIEEGDWCIVNGGLGRIGVDKYQTNVTYSIKPLKIVATTDKSLYRMSSHNIKVGLFDIPQQFLEEYVKAGGIDEVLLEYVYDQDTLDEYNKEIDYNGNTCINLEDGLELKTDQNNFVIIHPIEPKLYTKEEVIQIIYNSSYVLSNGDTTKSHADNWIKENLK